MIKQTNFSKIAIDDPIMTGNEKYLVVGDIIPEIWIRKVMQHFAGFKVHWNCIEKAQVAHQILNMGVVVVGKMHVMSGDKKSMYGFDFNPPLEFHSWIQWGENVIDFALPGVIEKGLITADEYGPYLVGLNPFILAGKVPSNLYYEPMEIVR